jgi:hypothetical protein
MSYSRFAPFTDGRGLSPGKGHDKGGIAPVLEVAERVHPLWRESFIATPLWIRGSLPFIMIV